MMHIPISRPPTP